MKDQSLAHVDDSSAQYFDEIYDKHVDNTYETKDVQRNRLDLSKSGSSSRSKSKIEIQSKFGENSRSRYSNLPMIIQGTTPTTNPSLK